MNFFNPGALWVPFLGGRFGYFYNFFLPLGEGEGGVRGDRQGGGGVPAFIENPRRGSPREGRGGGRGAGRVSAGNFRGEGAKYFFSGSKFHQVFVFIVYRFFLLPTGCHGSFGPEKHNTIDKKLRPRWPVPFLFRASGPKQGKIGMHRKQPPPENWNRNSRKTGKWPQNLFLSMFPIFRPFPLFSGEAVSYIFPTGRRPETYSVAGQRCQKYTKQIRIMRGVRPARHAKQPYTTLAEIPKRKCARFPSRRANLFVSENVVRNDRKSASFCWERLGPLQDRKPQQPSK